MRSHYEVLGLSEDASQATIRSTYLKLLQIYHPDHNSDARASAKTSEIIEAYAVLGDEAKRNKYDCELHSKPVGTTPPKKADTNQSNSVAARIACDKCGIQDSTLRGSVMYWVFSLVIVTRRGTKSGIWCERCRAKQAGIWSVGTGLLGWWGFPFGPIYTVPALYFNAIGGKQDPNYNAALLRLIAYQLYERGEAREALDAAEASTSFESDDATKRFAEYLRTLPVSAKKNQLPLFRLLTGIPSVAIVVIVAFLLYYALGLNSPSGYDGRYHGSSGSSTAPPKTAPKDDPARDAVNTYVDQLATAVEADATPTGATHQEGTTTIKDYELDRTKYSATPFYLVASEIKPYLENVPANADGFSSSAYFNAELMGLSVTILNGFSAGIDVSGEIHRVETLRLDSTVGPWIEGSKFREDFDQLCLILERMKASQTIGEPIEQRRVEIESLRGEIEIANTNVRNAEASHDSTSDQTWVRTQNREVDRYNSLIRRNRKSHALYEKADLAFNKCLDPAILMSKFEQVDLTKGEAAIAAMPDN